MSHQHYHTEGFILKQTPIGEKDLLLSIFTRDFGLVRAKLKAGRSLASKMRFHASLFAWVEVSLIKTRGDAWKIVGLDSKSSLFNFKQRPHQYQIVDNVISMLSRMVVGENPQEEIFTDLVDFFSVIKNGVEVEKEVELKLLASLEVVIVFRILYYLGYISPTTEMHDLLHTKIDTNLISIVAEQKRQVVGVINQAFYASGL